MATTGRPEAVTNAAIDALKSYQPRIIAEIRMQNGQGLWSAKRLRCFINRFSFYARSDLLKFICQYDRFIFSMSVQNSSSTALSRLESTVTYGTYTSSRDQLHVPEM